LGDGSVGGSVGWIWSHGWLRRPGGGGVVPDHGRADHRRPARPPAAPTQTGPIALARLADLRPRVPSILLHPPCVRVARRTSESGRFHVPIRSWRGNRRPRGDGPVVDPPLDGLGRRGPRDTRANRAPPVSRVRGSTCQSWAISRSGVRTTRVRWLCRVVHPLEPDEPVASSTTTFSDTRARWRRGAGRQDLRLDPVHAPSSAGRA